MIKRILKETPLIKDWIKRLNNENVRNAFVKHQLENIKPGLKILDAGCGSQQYRKYTNHLEYFDKILANIHHIIAKKVKDEQQNQ